MCIRWQGICLWAAVTLVHASGVFAQSNVTPEDEYRKAIKVSEDIQPLGESPFGEQISLYTGQLSFRQTDVSVAGQGPVLELSRQFQLEGKNRFSTPSWIMRSVIGKSIFRALKRLQPTEGR